jgi:hypothetical protein
VREGLSRRPLADRLHEMASPEGHAPPRVVVKPSVGFSSLPNVKSLDVVGWVFWVRLMLAVREGLSCRRLADRLHENGFA